MLDKDSRIYIAGHKGLLGSALMEEMNRRSFTNLLCRTHEELDLTQQAAVEAFFAAERPEYVVLNAAVPANSVNKRTNPMGLMLDNTLIIANVMSAAQRHGVKKLLYICSIACYPSHAALREGRLPETSLQPGTIEDETERYYAMPKLLGEEICRAVNRIGTMKCVTLVVPQSYGTFYHYEDPQRLQVFPALVKRFQDAKRDGLPEVVVWGTGNLRRELTFASDLADAYLLLMEREDAEGIYNVGTGKYISVREMAETIGRVTGYSGKIVFDATKPEAIEFPLLSSDRIRALGWVPKTTFEDGVKAACAYYAREFT